MVPSVVSAEWNRYNDISFHLSVVSLIYQIVCALCAGTVSLSVYVQPALNNNKIKIMKWLVVQFMSEKNIGSKQRAL